MKAFFTLLLSGFCSLSLAAANNNLVITPCEQVLQSPSLSWIQTYTQSHGTSTLEQVKAILRYEFCYSQALNQRKAALNKSGKGPLMGANGSFRDLEIALTNFTQEAIKPCGQSGDRVRLQRAYAELYQLQFRDYFYRSYEKTHPMPSVDAKRLNKAKAQLADLLKNTPPPEAAQLKMYFDQFRQVAIQANAMPEDRVYEYAVMVLQRKGPIAPSAPPF